MAKETDRVFAADQQNGKGELYRLMMSILKEGETDKQETAQQQPASEVEKANDEPTSQQTAVAQTTSEPQSVQQPAAQPQEQPKQQAERPNGDVEQPAGTVQPAQDVQSDELDEETKDLLAVKNHNIDDARKYVEKLGKDTQEIMASGMSEGAKRDAQERYENAAKTLNERIETHNAEQNAESDRLRAEAERKQAQAKKEHEEKYSDIKYVSDWMDGHKVGEENNTMLASEGFKEGAAAAGGKDIFGIAKAAKEYISENTGKLSTAAINDYVNGMLAAGRLKEKYGDKLSYNLEPIDSVVLENKDIPDSVKKEFVKVRTPKEFGDNNYQTILRGAVDDFVRLFEKEYRREQGNMEKKAMGDYENIAKNPFADADDKDAARMVYASKVLTGVDLKPMIDRAFNSIPKDRMAALTLALSKDFGYDENKAAEYIANEFQRVCLARTGAKVNSDTEAVIIGGLMNTLVGSIAQASMRSTGGGNKLTLLDAYSESIDERAKEWSKQGLAGYGKIALRSATTIAGDPAFGAIGKLVGGGTKWSLVRLLPRLSKGVTPKAGEAAFKMLSMTNSGRVVIGVANGAGLGAIYSPVAYSLGSLARGETPELGEALKSSASGAVDFSMMGFTPSIMNYGADKVLKLFNGTGKAATAIRVATNIAFKDIFGPGANAALVTAKDVLLSSEKISEDLKSYYFEKFGEFLGMHVPGKLSNIRHIADEYKVRTQLNESVFTKEELRSLGYKSVKQMFDDIYAPNGKNSPGYFMKDGNAIASKLYGITVNPNVLESAKMKLLTAIGGGAIATPTITRSEIVSEYGEKGKEVYTVRTYTADGKAFSERDFGSLKDAKLEETRIGTVIKRNNVAIAEGARDAQWMDTCSERATRTVLSELNGTATEKELTDMLNTALEKDRNGEQLTDGEKRMLKRFDEVYLQNLRSENADNSSSVRRDFNKSRGVDIDKILAKDYYKWSESEREAVDDYIKALNGENTAKDMQSEQAEPTAISETPAEPANETPVVEAEKGGQQEVAAPEKEAEKPIEETLSKDGVGIEDYIKINKADDETANDIREDAENYTDEVNALRSESEQAVRYSNGESSEKPEHWDYWKEKFGLEEPKAKTEEEVKPVEEPKADSEPIEQAKDNPAEQPKEQKAEEKPVEVETPKEEAKADTKSEVEQAAETEPVEETDNEQPTVEQPKVEETAYKKGEELVVEHDGNPVTIVVDAVGKDGNVTKSHVKSSGEPYHSNGKVVFTKKEKPQGQAVKDWVDDTASEARKRGYRIVNGEREADVQGGTGGTAEEGSNSLIGAASKVTERERVNSRLKDLSERVKTAKTDEERAQVASERAEVVSEYVKGEKGRSVSVVSTQDALADAVESRDLKNEVRQHTESGDLLNGVYDNRTGKIHIVAENVETADDIDAVYIHESSHKYSREVDNNRAAGELVDNHTTEELEQALREVAGDDVADVYMACKAGKGDFAYRRMLADEILAYSCVKRNTGEETGITNENINNQTKQHYEKVSDYFRGRKRDGVKSDRGTAETGEGVSTEPSTGEHGRGGANDRKEEGIDNDGFFSVSGKMELKDNTLMPDSEKPEWLKKTKASSGDGEEMTLGEYYETLYGRRRRMMPTISPLLERAKEKITDDGHLVANDKNGRLLYFKMFLDNTGELSRYKNWLLGTLEKSPSKTLKEEILREIEYLNQQYTHWNLARKGRLVKGFGAYGDFAREFGISKETREIAELNGIDVDEVFKDGNGGFFSVAGRNANSGNTGYDSKHSEIEQAVNMELGKKSTSDDIKAEIDRVKKLRAEATKEYLSGKPHSEVAKGDAAALRERLNELNAKKTVAVENERSAKLTEKLSDLNSKLIEATESGDTEKAKSLTTEIKRLKTDIANTGIRARYKAKISEIKSKSENVSDLAKSLVKYISGELSPILAKEMGKAEFNALAGSVRDIAKQWNAKDGTEQDRNNLATKLDDTIRKVDDVIVGIETRKLINDLADMLSVKTTKKDSSGKKVGVKVSNTVRIAIETLKGVFRDFDGDFGKYLNSLVKSLDGMLAKKKSLQGRLKELELSEASANERLNSGAITKDEYDAEIDAINRERDDVKSEMENFDTVFSDALSETNDAIDSAFPIKTYEYNKLWNDLMTKQQDEQDGVAQMSAHDKEMLKIMPFVRSLVDVRELFAEADKSQSRLKALEEQWKSDAPTPTDTEMESANRRDRRLQTALKIREERARLYAAKDAARNALRDLNNDVRSLLKIGKTQYMAQQQARMEHRSEVAHIGIAAVDTGKERPAGVKGQQEAKEGEEKSVGVLRRMWNWLFLAPTESAESMLSRVDVNHFSGEGELYHMIIESERGYSRSEDRRIESVEALRSEIQSKCKELFGSKKPKDGNKKIKFTQTLSGEPVPAEVTKGEALSLYLWSLSEEGRAKLESQGIDAFSISEIKAGLGDNWVKFGEWIVGDFLPKLYDKYNEKYVEKYGTEITRHENYFPFKIYGGDIVTKDELESFDNGNTIPMPSALKERVKHSYQLSTTEDALKILNEHVAEMEDWYHFADMREDISILLSSRAFRETLKLQGQNKWRRFRDAMHTLAGVDKRDESVTSQVINEVQSMYASSAVGFRYWTALKQWQSTIAGMNYSYDPRFQARLLANILMPVGTELLAGKVKNAENTFAGIFGSCYWAWKNMPQFRERYRNGKMGNIMLEYESVVGNRNRLYRWIKKNISQMGLFLNKVFDAAAVAVYSKSIYDYEFTRSIRNGATDEDAHKYAMTCAETNYNKTQQSSGRAYVSKMQVSGNPIEKGLTTFQTASLGFMRKSINHINDIQRAYRLLRLGKEKPLHSISKGAKATVDLLWDGVVMPASWNLINVIGVAGFYYGAKAIFNALFGGDDDNAPMKDATGKTALDRFIEGHAGDVAFATISAPLQGTILNNLVNSAWSGYGGWTPTMAEGAISEVLRSAGETLKGYKDSDSLSDYLEDLDEDAAKYTIKTVLYALFRGYTGIDMKTVERFYNAFYDYKLNGSSLNLISVANFLSTPMSNMRDHEAKDYYLGAYGKTSETAKDLEDYIVKRAYADGKIFKRDVESGGARGKVAELFRSRAFKRDLNKYVDEWAEYHIRDASDAADYHDEWLKNHERKEIIRKNRELEYSDEQAKQKTDSLKLALGYEQKSGNSERTLRYNLVHGILGQIKKKLTGGDDERKEAFALMRELERIDKVKGHTHSDYVKLAEKAGVKDFQMIPKGVSESGKYVNKSDINNGTVARGDVKGSYGIIATADDVKADARFRKLQDGSEKQKAKAKEVMKMYSDGDISYQDAYRRMTDIGDGLVTAVYTSEADRLIKDLKTKLTKAVKAGNDKAADAIMERIRYIRGKVIEGDMKPKEEVAKMLLNSIE